MTELTAQPKRSIGTLIWLIVSQLLALGSLLIWAVLAGLSVMAFDSGQSPAAWTFVLAVWAYPSSRWSWPSARGSRSHAARTAWQPCSPG